MLYGDMKVRTISRSVLPAGRRKARSTRKDKQAWNQSTRHRMDRDLRRGFSPGMTAEATIEAWEGNPSAWLDTYSPRERDAMDYIRADRREADKLGPVRQWTRSHIKDFEDRYDLIEFVGRTLPDNLAGRHALGHMNSEFGPDSYRYRYVGPTWREHQRFARACDYANAVADLELLLVHSHAELNRRIRNTHVVNLHCPHHVRTSWEKAHSYPKASYNFSWVPCRGYLKLDKSTFYDRSIVCPNCSRRLQNHNLRPISTPADIPKFIEGLNAHAGVGHAKLITWIAEEAARQKGFLSQPERIERRKALVSLSGHVLAA